MSRFPLKLLRPCLVISGGIACALVSYLFFKGLQALDERLEQTLAAHAPLRLVEAMLPSETYQIIAEARSLNCDHPILAAKTPAGLRQALFAASLCIAANRDRAA